ncbi:uncharacterized protein G2W53_014205 [Senna tora]|uniref:Uncharacterized protein n=1 Tax=Senna tora TaxID=362788 RepID=A0A835C7K7_9FABA|nr:uncharacterized protein G2W53_014205 [Senna tora]
MNRFSQANPVVFVIVAYPYPSPYLPSLRRTSVAPASCIISIASSSSHSCPNLNLELVAVGLIAGESLFQNIKSWLCGGVVLLSVLMPSIETMRVYCALD